jgi:hypothetical protein
MLTHHIVACDASPMFSQGRSKKDKHYAGEVVLEKEYLQYSLARTDLRTMDRRRNLLTAIGQYRMPMLWKDDLNELPKACSF